MSAKDDPVVAVIRTLPAATADLLAERLTDPQRRQLILNLRQTYTAEGVALWLRARNRNLSRNSPTTLLFLGGDFNINAVIAEATRVGNA